VSILEQENDGYDSIVVNQGWTIPDNVERLIARGAAKNQKITGNDLDNNIINGQEIYGNGGKAYPFASGDTKCGDRRGRVA